MIFHDNENINIATSYYIHIMWETFSQRDNHYEIHGKLCVSTVWDNLVGLWMLGCVKTYAQ